MNRFADSHVHIRYEDMEKTIDMPDEIHGKGVTDVSIPDLLNFEKYCAFRNGI